MKTTFTGDRVPRAVVPIVEDFISTFKLKPTQSSDKRKSIGGSSSSSSSGGSSSSSSSGGGKFGQTNPASVLPESKGTTVIKQKLSTKNFGLTEYLTQNGKFLNTMYGSGDKNGGGSGKPLTKENPPVGITLHWSAGDTYKGAHSTLISRGNGKTYSLSYHIEVGEDGVPYQFSSLFRTAAHAGCPADKGSRCKDLNKYPPTIAISYVGGVEGGYGTNTDSGCARVAYARSWEDWQTEEISVPFCKHGAKRGRYGLKVCCKENENCGYGCFKGSNATEYSSFS